MTRLLAAALCLALVASPAASAPSAAECKAYADAKIQYKPGGPYVNACTEADLLALGCPGRFTAQGGKSAVADPNAPHRDCLAAGKVQRPPTAAQSSPPSPASQPHTAQRFQPQVGQSGKDVIWVPTPDEVVERMLTMAQVTPNDLVMDLGAGDGKIAIAAAKKFGARAIGIEYNPDMVKHANANAQKAGVAGEGKGRAVIRHGDIFATDFSKADVITMYLLPALNMKLRPQILSMKPGTRVVSHSFTMEDWEADEISSSDGRRAYFWIVPAPVMGTWSLEAGGRRTEMQLEQTFQKVQGTVALGALHAGLREPRLRGAQISFAYVDANAVRRDFTGRVNGNRIEGTFRDDKGQEGRWTATKR